MRKKLQFVLLPLLSLIFVHVVVQAATITSCAFDKGTYHQGETGYITVAIYNDKSEKIRVTELIATIEYHYTDGNIYLQSFFTDSILPSEIERGQSGILYIPFSLPTNIASGYIEVDVKAKTEIWSVQTERWLPSEHPTYQPTLYIESPYKTQSEGRLLMMYLLGTVSIVLAVMTIFLVVLNRRARYIAQPVA